MYIYTTRPCVSTNIPHIHTTVNIVHLLTKLFYFGIPSIIRNLSTYIDLNMLTNVNYWYLFNISQVCYISSVVALGVAKSLPLSLM